MNSRCHDQVKRVLLSYDILGKITRETERERDSWSNTVKNSKLYNLNAVIWEKKSAWPWKHVL